MFIALSYEIRIGSSIIKSLSEIKEIVEQQRRTRTLSNIIIFVSFKHTEYELIKNCHPKSRNNFDIHWVFIYFRTLYVKYTSRGVSSFLHEIC